MQISRVAKLVNARLIYSENPGAEIEICCCSDLMAELLRLDQEKFSKPEKAMLITGLYNLQTINTAELLDIRHILFVRGNKLAQPLRDAARDRGISALKTEISMFEACGLLYHEGIKPAF